VLINKLCENIENIGAVFNTGFKPVADEVVN